MLDAVLVGFEADHVFRDEARGVQQDVLEVLWLDVHEVERGISRDGAGEESSTCRSGPPCRRPSYSARSLGLV